jgi:UDP-glucose 4-epimerase
LGNDEPITIKALAEKILQLTQSKSTLQFVSYDQAYGRPFDDMHERVPDLTKARRLIGYKPAYSLTQALQQVIDFEKNRCAS